MAKSDPVPAWGVRMLMEHGKTLPEALEIIRGMPSWGITEPNVAVRNGVVSPRDLMKIRLDPSEFDGEDAVQPGDQLDVSGLGMLHGVAPGLYRVRSVDAEAQEVELELAKS